MLVEPRAPGGTHPIPWLQDRTQPATRAAPHQTEMAPVLARHQLEDGARLPLPPRAQHNALIAPLHRLNPKPIVMRELSRALQLSLSIHSPSTRKLHYRS